jgi:hypothetical protein
MNETLEFSYRKPRAVERDDAFGRVARWMGDHPIAAGLIAGLGVVGIAVASVPGALTSAPREALVLSGLVVGVWTMLFFLMRQFFRDMGQTEIEETFSMQLDDEAFVWEREGEIEVELAGPRLSLYAARPIDEEAAGSEPAEVYLVIEGDEGGRFVLETSVTEQEAAEYPIGEGLEADESLPIHMASGLLQRVERG